MEDQIDEGARPAAPQRIALVTGAAGAMGQAIADRLARSGIGLVLTDIGEDMVADIAEAVRRRHDVPVHALAADLSCASASAHLMGEAIQLAGRMDFLVNNAGFNRPSALEDVRVEDWDKIFAVNLRAPMILAQAALPAWRRQGSGGAIVNIGSRVWVSGAVPGYTASKAGLVGLTRSLAVELGPLGVTANVVAPSFVDTPFTRKGRSELEVAAMHERALAISPVPRLGRVEDIAGTVAFLLSDEASYITGEVIHVCGGSQLAARSTSPLKD